MNIINKRYLLVLIIIFLSGCTNSKVDKSRLGYKIDINKVIYGDYYISSSSYSHDPNSPIGLGAFVPKSNSISGIVIYTTKVLDDVDIKTFKKLKDGYAKDKNGAYYKGENLSYYNQYKHINKEVFKKFVSDDFKVLKDGYAKDKNSAYYKGKKLFFYDHNEDINKEVIFKKFIPENFEVLKDGYAKDKKSVYYKGKKLLSNDETNYKEVSPKNFVFLKYGYVKNDNHVFFKGILQDWDSKSFKIIDSDCVMDNNNILIENYNNEYYIINHKDIRFDYKTFERVYYKNGSYFEKTNFFKDKNNIYYKGSILSFVDVPTFGVMLGNFIKDAFHIYYRKNKNYPNNGEFEIVTDDVKNFKSYYIENSSGYKWLSSYSRDSNNVYYICCDKIKKLNISPESFEIISYFYAKNDKNIYYRGKILNCDYKTFKVREKTFFNSADAEDKDYYYKNEKISGEKWF